MRRLLLCLLAAPLSAQSVPTWKLVEEWRVGGDVDGPHSFDANLGLGLLPGGGLVQFNYKSHQLHFLDATGKALKTVSRVGSGPGETRDANGLAVSPKGIVVLNDRGNARFTRFTPGGVFLDVITDVGIRMSMGNRWDATFLSDGRLYERVGLVATGGADVRPEIWSADLKHVTPLHPESCNPASAEDFARTRVPIINLQGQLILYVPLPGVAPSVVVAVDPAGYVWEARNLDSNEIVRRAIGSCVVTATVRLPGARGTLTSAQASKIRSRIEGYGKQVEGRPPVIPPLPRQLAWFDTLHVDAAANLWVERFTDAGRVVEVYDSSGKPLARLDKAWAINSMGPMIITRDHLYALTSDRDGVAYLEGMRIIK